MEEEEDEGQPPGWQSIPLPSSQPPAPAPAPAPTPPFYGVVLLVRCHYNRWRCVGLMERVDRILENSPHILK